jgi:uncharacterized membrane protein YgdD (TMEM256/DUF423 family)
MRIWLAIAALCGGLAVIAGALGEHALAQTLEPRALLAFNTAASYQMYHALAIGLAALAMRPANRAWAGRAAAFFLIGIILFSGSLYLWALSGMHVLVFMPPLGGLAFIVGWGLLAVAGWKLEER